MSLIRVKMRADGTCRKGSKHYKGRKGCLRKSKSSMGKRK
jgi:hypothetical protein